MKGKIQKKNSQSVSQYFLRSTLLYCLCCCSVLLASVNPAPVPGKANYQGRQSYNQHQHSKGFTVVFSSLSDIPLATTTLRNRGDLVNEIYASGTMS